MIHQTNWMNSPSIDLRKHQYRMVEHWHDYKSSQASCSSSTHGQSTYHSRNIPNPTLVGVSPRLSGSFSSTTQPHISPTSVILQSVGSKPWQASCFQSAQHSPGCTGSWAFSLPCPVRRLPPRLRPNVDLPVPSILATNSGASNVRRYWFRPTLCRSCRSATAILQHEAFDGYRDSGKRK